MTTDPGFPGHKRSDPACLWHRPARSWLVRWWLQRRRGKPCTECIDIRAKSRRCTKNQRCILTEHDPWTSCLTLRDGFLLSSPLRPQAPAAPCSESKVADDHTWWCGTAPAGFPDGTRAYYWRD